MNKTKLNLFSKIILSFFALIIMIFMIYVICVIHVMFFTSNCKEFFIKEEYSPNKAIKAVYYEFDCGATSGRSHHVKITDLSNKNEKQVFSIDGIPKSDIINISWINDKHLVLEYQDNDNEDLCFSKNNQWDIKIDYKAIKNDIESN